MASGAQSNQVTGLQSEFRGILDCLDVMNFKPDAFPAPFVVVVPAFLAGEVVTVQNNLPDSLPFSSIHEPPMTAFPVAVQASGGDAVGVSVTRQSFIPGDLPPLAIKPLGLVVGVSSNSLMEVGKAGAVVGMTGPKPHPFNGRMISLGKPAIPAGDLGLVDSSVWMMPPDVFGDIQSGSLWATDNDVVPRIFPGSSIPVNRERLEFGTAPTSADSSSDLLLSSRDTHNPSNLLLTILANWKAYENRVNCWNPLRADNATAWQATASAIAKKGSDWEISSQAAWEQVAGSTTRARSPERTVKPHECAGRKVRDGLGCLGTGRSTDKEPCDNTLNSVNYTGKLNDLSRHPVQAIINKVLKVDATETLDTAAYNEFNSTLLTVVGATSSTINTIGTTATPGATNNIELRAAHVKLISDQMKERNIPGYFDSGDYGCIARPATFRAFKNDLESLHQYVVPGFTLIMNGEIGRYEGTRFFEQTNIASEGWTNAKSDAAFFFGADTVHEGIAVLEEIRARIPYTLH